MKLILLVLICTCVFPLEIDNSVTERPDVHCGIDNIVVEISTEKPFKGRLYVQGEAENERCFQTAKETSSSHVTFHLPIGACNMRRQRTMHPRGVSFSFSLVVSFHHYFVTGMDRAFHIRCFFLESVKNLHTEFSVGTLKTEVVEQEFQLPECIYQLRDGINGPTLQYAQVGQRVTHRWSCEDGSSWVYGILIHSCFADDGQGNKFELVDDRGCSTDSYLLPQIGYEPNSLSAFTNAQVFKYADKVQLYFTCTVQLCYKHDGGCEGVTPPVCDHDSNYLPGVTPPHHDIDSPSIGGEGEPEENAMYNEFPPESKPFFGPIDPMDGYGSSKYRDSPLNETEVEDMSLIASNSSAAGKRSDRTTKKRRDLNMETDLSVDVIVLPFDEKTGYGRSIVTSPSVCFSRMATLLLLLSVVITAALCTVIGYILARRSTPYQKSMDAFH